MQESFYKMIVQVGTFVICAQVIIHFRPKEAYGKYLKLLLSVMVLVQLFQPFGDLFFGYNGEYFQERVSFFQEEMDRHMSEVAERAVISEQKLQEISLQEVQEHMAAQAVERLQEEENKIVSEEAGDGEKTMKEIKVEQVEIRIKGEEPLEMEQKQEEGG